MLLDGRWCGAIIGSKDGNAPGGHADARYKRGMKSWRARNRWVFILFLGPFVLLGIVAFVLDRHFLAWGGGVIAGAAIGAWVALRGEGADLSAHLAAGC